MNQKSVSYHEQYSYKKRNFEWETSTEYPCEIFSQEEVVKLVKSQRLLAEKPMRVIKVTTITEEIEVFI